MAKQQGVCRKPLEKSKQIKNVKLSRMKSFKKTIEGLKGVHILSKAAQKKIIAGKAAGCGILVTYPGSNTRYVLYTPDANGNGSTMDDAKKAAASSNDIYNENGGYVQATGGWCCDSCGSFPTAS